MWGVRTFSGGVGAGIWGGGGGAQCAQRLQKVFWVIFAFQISLTESDQKLSEFSNKKRIKGLSFLVLEIS